MQSAAKAFFIIILYSMVLLSEECNRRNTEHIYIYIYKLTTERYTSDTMKYSAATTVKQAMQGMNARTFVCVWRFSIAVTVHRNAEQWVSIKFYPDMPVKK